MAIRTCKPRTWDPDSGSSPFEFVVEEVERIRYYNSGYRSACMPARSTTPSPGQSLRSHRGHVVHLNQLNEPGLEAAGKHTFEIAKARKL